MPIGLTASGEIVFPIQCRELIERQRGKAVEQKPAVVEEKAAAKQSEAPAPESSKPAIKPVETVSLPKRLEHKPRERAVSPDDANRNVSTIVRQSCLVFRLERLAGGSVD